VFPGLDARFSPNVDDVAEHFGLPLPPMREGDDLVGRSLNIVAVGRLLADALHRVGVRPDLMAGHSIGEWTAMTVGGLYGRDAVDGLMSSLGPGSLTVPDVVYAAVACGAERVEKVLAGRDGVAISHDNCPHQSVICGLQEPVSQASESFRAEGVLTEILPFRSGFHSPMFAAHVPQVKEIFSRLRVLRAQVPIWSATTVDRYPSDPDGVQDLIVRHLVEPVRFGPLVRRLHREGVRGFIQVGDGSLVGFIGDTLRGEGHLAVAANDSKSSGMDALVRAACALWTEGREVDWNAFVRAAPSTSSKRPQAPAVEKPSRLIAQFEDVLKEMESAVVMVRQAWEQRRSAPPAERKMISVIELSLESHPFVRDHCLIPQAPDWQDTSDMFPVVPLTTMLEMMAEAARKLVPNGVVTGYEQIRAFRWLTVEPPVQVEIDARLDGVNRVKVDIKGHASGVVNFGSAFPPPREMPSDLSDERPPPIPAARIYSEGWLFHGPQFGGIREVQSVSEQGIRARFEVLPAPGAILDCAGQVVCHWVQLGEDPNRIAFPVSVARITYYSPQPALGDLVDCTARIHESEENTLRAEVGLSVQGRPLALIEDLINRRFGSDEATWEAWIRPSTRTISERQPEGWFMLPDRLGDAALSDLMTRRYLSASERAEYAARAPRGRRQWLLGRIAAKDAVRSRLWEEGHGPLFPAEVVVTNDDLGRPMVRVPGNSVYVSIAHKQGMAVAIASGSQRVGIDIEQVAPRGEAAQRMALAPEEQEILAAQADGDWGFTRFWASKEAVAKARGTGLNGRPRDYRIAGTKGSDVTVTAGGQEWSVCTRDIRAGQDFVVAWTALP
jgi:malonyl CoA-acyl carrier protein transacylase/phosphopantetheinyl transferase